jgi:hypothetical protein
MTHAKQIAELIRSTEALNTLATAGDDTGLFDALTSRTIHHVDSTLYSVAKIGDVFSIDDARTVLAVMEQAAAADPLVRPFWARLNTLRTDGKEGLDFSIDKVQEMIDAIFTGELAPLAAPLKAIGIRDISICEQRLGVQPTSEDMPSIVAEYGKIRLAERVADAARAVIAGVESGEVVDWADVVSMMGEL